jgi:uncharacterized protein (DUF302 family)
MRTSGFRWMVLLAGLAASLLAVAGEQGAPPGDIVKVPLAEGVSIQDAVDSLKLRANALNIKMVGEKPLYKEVEALSGKPYRYVHIFEFCDALTASKMLDYNPDIVVYMPCRIALYQDLDGKAWIGSINMDRLVEMVQDPELKKEAQKVRDGMMEIMQAGANGEL